MKINKLLKLMCQRKDERVGPGFVNLEKGAFLITEGCFVEKTIPSIVICSGGFKRYQLPRWAKEAEFAGYVQFSDSQTYFWLTPEGCRVGSAGLYASFLSFCKENKEAFLVIAAAVTVVSTILTVIPT